ncbi:biotin-dependent carboxyltransferase family protein [Glaciibacter flavus]|uniref:5-oxoprolinase subunit C family protein n=1 Tax=Orlajensenia flava TaxID=2565934 RepID=UPI001F3ABF78|nr:biotin-dependent carboxyltransferase family protein [Glaciibacter flavus]
MIEVVAPGPLSLIEDLGRPGHADVGVTRSGALDRRALTLANRLVGNQEAAAAIEVTVGGLFVRFEEPTWFAVTGAWGPMSLSGSDCPSDTAVLARGGSVLSLGPADHGARYYVAVRGGIDVDLVLGSRSTDTLSGLGPAPLAAGDMLPVGRMASVPIPAVDTLTLSAPTDGPVDVAVHLGPRDDWFSEEALVALFDSAWTVGADSNRIGMRLGGPALERSGVGSGELRSEGMVGGSIQVSPSGQPTVLLADHPVTGGYPVIAVVADADLDTFAQLRPGQSVRFRHAPPLP